MGHFFVPIEGQNDPKSIRTVSRWHDPILGLLWVHILPILDPLVIWKEKKIDPKKTKKIFFFNFWSVESSKVYIYAQNHMLSETRGPDAAFKRKKRKKILGVF